MKTIKRVKKDLNSKLKMFQEILDDRLEEPSPSFSAVKSPAQNGSCQVDKVSIGGLDNYRYVKKYRYRTVVRYEEKSCRDLITKSHKRTS